MTTPNANTSSSSNTNKKKNPLYVVNKKKKLVEPASSVLDYWVKKWGLTQYVKFLEELLSTALKQINSAPMIHEIIEYFQKFLGKIIAGFNALGIKSA
ncbi:MAG: hypothetical protein QE271_02910 [Bacteriovoracaceae bacterium]|nr:hypothetical protein [Bacteriovoracaceae bacterium]